MAHWFHRNPLKSTADVDFNDLLKTGTAKQSINLIIEITRWHKIRKLPMGVFTAEKIPSNQHLAVELKKTRTELMKQLMQPTTSVDVVTNSFNQYVSLVQGLCIAPDSEGGNESKLRYATRFKWSSSLTGTTPLVRSDIEFDLSNTMVDVAIWLTKKANNICTQQSITDDDALIVYRSLKTAAGIFAYVRDKRADKLKTDITEVKCHDLDHCVLTAYERQSLAEAQEVTIARAINLKHKPSLIAGLAKETSSFFQKAATSLSALEKENAAKVSKWIKYLDLKDHIYQAYAWCYYGNHLLDDQEKAGEAIRCLKESQLIFEKASNELGRAYASTKGPGTTAQPWKHPFFIRVSRNVDLTLRKCEGENNIIYHAKVPTELPSLEVKASYGLADPIAYEMPALHEKWTSEAYKCFDLSRNMPANPKEADKKKKQQETEDKKELDPIPEPDIPTGSSCSIS